MKEKKYNIEDNISIDSRFYKSDNIVAGRVIKTFFKELSLNIFKQSYKYFKEYVKFPGSIYLPLFEGEEKCQSTVACAINELTPVHLTEWPFPESKRFIDFWCQMPNSGKAYNYFIELKHGYYCCSEGTNDKPHCVTENNIKTLEAQILSIKRDIKAQWGDENIYMGLMIIPGFYNKKKKSGDNTSRNMLSYIHEKDLDKRHRMQMIMATWQLPDDVKQAIKENEDYSWCADWISIVGIILTKAK